MCEATKKKIEVMQAFVEGKTIESRRIGETEWTAGGNIKFDEPNWNWERLEYRVKELTKPSIDWSHVADEFKWMATNETGQTFLFELQPRAVVTGSWYAGKGDFIYAPNYSSFKPGYCDWKNSLVKREE